MAVALAGLALLRKQAKEWMLPAILVVLAGGYVISSWWCWWYGGNFGNRVFIDLFPLLSPGLAAVIALLVKMWRKTWQRVGLFVAGGLFVALNLFQTLQYTRGLIHYDAMTPAAYRAVFGKLHAPENLDSLLEHPDYDRALKGIYD
jgi:hypothetical protein